MQEGGVASLCADKLNSGERTLVGTLAGRSGPASRTCPTHQHHTLPRLQGGEFAFVLLALANQLNVLPADLNRLLIIVVVLSMVSCPAPWWQMCIENSRQW